MKRIIYSTFDDYTSEGRGGTAIAVHEVAKRLIGVYQVTVLAAKRDGSHDQIIDGVKYRHIGIAFGDMRIRQLVYLFLLPWQVFFRKYDVWIEAFTGPISTAFLPLFTRRPVIGVTHFFNGDEMKKKYKFPFDEIERIGVGIFRHLIVLTQFQEQKVFTMNRCAEVRIIPNGIDNRFSLIQRNPKAFLLYVGRIEVYMKGLDMLIDSTKEILISNDKLKLMFAGKGSERDKDVLQKKIIENSLSQKVIFQGYVTEQQKDILFSEALLFLTPSRFETFGISLLEAMRAGVPAIVFDIPDFQWIPDDCVMKVPKFDLQKYSEQVLFLLNNPEEREALGCRGRSFAQDFTWDNVAKKYEEYIEDITSKNA